MNIDWIPVTEQLPDCTEWDSDREAFIGERLLTSSTTHGVQINYPRMDDFMWPQIGRTERHRSRERTFKWGLSGHDLTITHWMPMIEQPVGSEVITHRP